MMTSLDGNNSNVVDLNVWNVFDDGEMNRYQTCFHLLDLMSNNFLCLKQAIIEFFSFLSLSHLDCLVNVESSENNHLNLNYVE